MDMRPRWKTRCARCGNPRHFAFFYWRGWLIWTFIVRPWPVSWGVPPLLSIAGDCIFDIRECGGIVEVEDAFPFRGQP